MQGIDEGSDGCRAGVCWERLGRLPWVKGTGRSYGRTGGRPSRKRKGQAEAPKQESVGRAPAPRGGPEEASGGQDQDQCFEGFGAGEESDPTFDFRRVSICTWRAETPEGRGGHQETSLAIVAGDQTAGLGLTGGSRDRAKWREGRAGGGEESRLMARIWGYGSCEAAGPWPSGEH